MSSTESYSKSTCREAVISTGMKMPCVSNWGATRNGVEMYQNNPVPVTHNTACQSETQTQRPAPKGRAKKRAPSKIEKVEPHREARRKMRVLKSKKRDLCGMLRDQRNTGSGITPNPAGPKAMPGELWEVDSGFSSEVSPPASGRSSPCAGIHVARLVSMDCEMVGTGPEGRCSELARCSLVNYHGKILYDRYVQPRQPVTDYRTRWSGICQHHLLHAVPFQQAQREILQVLDGKVVVGHALHNDFRALGFIPPRHLIRDTSCTHLLRKLSNMPIRGSVSLKNLAKVLLNRNIQMGKVGHSSVEDALAAMDLYKLVEAQWEQDVLNKGQQLDTSPSPVQGLSTNHYMEDQYWPADLMED